MRTLLIILGLLWPVFCSAAEMVIVPRVVNAGEVAWVRWNGPKLSAAALRFEETVVPLQERNGRWEALFGVDVDTEPGTYPVYAFASTPDGHSYNLRIDLTVRGVKRPTEHLNLPPAMVSPQDPEILKRIGDENLLLKNLWKSWSGPLRAELFERPVPHTVSSVFGKRRVLNGIPKSPHSGTDFRSPAGTLVVSPARGKVVLATELYYTGQTVIVDHGGGLYSLMAHLNEALVKVGDEVDRGSPLGRVGSTGRSTGPHLHWTVKLHGVRVDPMAVIKAFAVEPS